LISVICPVYNEKEHIEKLLRFFITSGPKEKELLVIDGGSDDGTGKIVKEWLLKYDNIRFLDNPDNIVPFALNIGVKNSRGDIIVRIDAHTVYSSDYFEKILETFNKTNADIVGGPTRIYAETAMQEAIGFVMSHPFGIGGSKVHDDKYEGYVDHVTFGAWKKELFNNIGLFDERLKRNQDDEFHYRAKSMGKKIYLNPEIKLWYCPRKKISAFFKQYFQYGLYKPLVLKKVKSEFKLRHIIPSLFVIYILSIPVSLLTSYWLIPLFLYLVIISFISFRVKIKFPFMLLILFPVIHISYGSGFILGLFKK
jgi:glycosyltransferase involved in cell wall biosynthesis